MVRKALSGLATLPRKNYRRDISIRVVAFVAAMGLLTLAGVSGPARAEGMDRQYAADGVDIAPPGDVEEREWYGKPMLATDLVALGVFTGGVVAFEYNEHLGGALLLASVGAYLLNGPIVHFYAERIGVGFGSLAMRAGSPVVGFGTGFLVGAVASKGCGTEGCQLAYGIVGGGIGILGGAVTAAIIDNALLARKPVSSRRLALSVVPIYQPETQQMSLLFQGAW
jgi:hypothetical protein